MLGATEFTLETTSYAYEELDTNNQFFMSDKSSVPFLGFGIREWDLGALKEIKNRPL